MHPRVLLSLAAQVQKQLSEEGQMQSAMVSPMPGQSQSQSQGQDQGQSRSQSHVYFGSQVDGRWAVEMPREVGRRAEEEMSWPGVEAERVAVPVSVPVPLSWPCEGGVESGCGPMAVRLTGSWEGAGGMGGAVSAPPEEESGWGGYVSSSRGCSAEGVWLPVGGRDWCDPWQESWMPYGLSDAW